MNQKILFFSYWYPNKKNKSQAIFIKRHAHAISLNHSLIVLSVIILKENTLFKKRVEVTSDENNISTHTIYLSSIFNKLLYVFLPFQYVILKKYIRQNIKNRFDFNLVHSNILFPAAIVGYRLSKKFNSKHVITEHWSKLDKFFKRSLYKHQGKKALDNAYAITSVSSFLKETIKKYTENKNIVIVPNVVDTGIFKYDPQIKKNGLLTFIAVAHWSAPKNPFYFLDALQQISLEKKISPFKMVIVGNGPLLNGIKSKNYDFEIEMKGDLNPNELNKALNESHIFLHGSDYETFSVIIAEALMCGLPSVVSPVGIAKEVIDQQSGYIAVNTVPDWKEKILLCVATKYNHKNISEKLSDSYSAQTVSDLFSKLYNKGL